MIYEYVCSGCSGTFDIVKPVADYEREELCPQSMVTMTRVFIPKSVHLYNTSVQERTWNPAFGKALTDNEARALAKEQNLIEIGNEDPKKFIKPKVSEYSF